MTAAQCLLETLGAGTFPQAPPFILPVADTHWWQHLGRQFRQHSYAWQTADLLPWLTVLFLLALGVYLLSRYLRYREGAAYCSHTALFIELCRAHRLGWATRLRMWRLARHRGLHSPAQLFLEPQHFQPDVLNGSSQDGIRHLQALRSKLFD